MNKQKMVKNDTKDIESPANNVENDTTDITISYLIIQIINILKKILTISLHLIMDNKKNIHLKKVYADL